MAEEKTETGSKKIEDLNEIKAERATAAAQPAPPKRKRGRPKKQPDPPPAPEPQLEIDKAQTGALLGFMFDTIAARAGEKWKLSKQENEAGAEVLTALFDKYAPVAGKYAVEISAGFWLVSVVLPRLDFSPKPQPVAQPGDDAEVTISEVAPGGSLTKKQKDSQNLYGVQ